MTQNKHLSPSDQARLRLFERGWVYSRQQENSLPVEVSRGMKILTSEGQEAGKVAAVVVDKNSQKVTHVLLGRLHLAPEYRLVPVELIEQVSEETVSLQVCSQVVESLPTRRGAG